MPTDTQDDSINPGWLQETQAYEQRLGQLLEQHKLFSPHARLVFETVEKIGEGGMGSIHRVRDRRLEREAALKLLNDPEPNSSTRQRFLREAKITAQLDHPAIPPVYEAGLSSDGQLFILMRLIRGRTLSEHIRATHDQGQDPRVLLEALVKVCEAVAYAHSQGVIHRDLKPDNIMLGEFGEVLVMDWGIAKLQSEPDATLPSNIDAQTLTQAGLTVDGAIIGTLGYMAPEQLEARTITAQADVYSLGLILFECLTGTRAFNGTVLEVVAATSTGQLPSLRSLKPQAPRVFEWIIARATQPELSDRTASVLVFKQQLKAWLAGQPVPAYPYSARQRLRRFMARHAPWLLPLFLLLVLLTVFASVALNLDRQREQARRRALESQLQAQAEEQKRREAERQADLNQQRLNSATAEVQRVTDVLAAFNEAESLLQRGAPKHKIRGTLDSALKRGGRSHAILTRAADLAGEAGLDDLCESLLYEITDKFPPAYSALFKLHLQTLKKQGAHGFRRTPALTRLVALSQKHRDENEYSLYALALKKHGQGKNQEAMALYNRILEYSKTLAPVYTNRGWLKQEQGDLSGALEDFNKALELDPRSYHALVNRGILSVRRERLKAAMTDFNKAIDIAPKVALAYFNRAGLLARVKEFQRARSDLDKAIQLDPNNALFFNKRGKVMCELKNLRDALKDFERALELNPKLSEARVHLSRVQEAVAKGSQILETKQPQSASEYMQRGFLHKKLGHLEKALSDFDKAVTLNPDGPLGYANRGRVRLLLKDYAAARQDIEIFLRLAPDHPGAEQMRQTLRRLERSR